MGFVLFIFPSCSPQKPYGQLSTSRSSISTLQPSRSSTQKSPTNASLSSSSPNKSNHAPISIGGQSQSSRINYPEVVSLGIFRIEFSFEPANVPPFKKYLFA